MREKRCLIPLIISLYLAGCTGAAVLGGAAAGIVGYKFYEGALEVTYQAPYMQTWDAALRVMDRMKLQVRRKEHDLTAGTIEAKRVDKKDVKLHVKYRSSNETDVVIRVGIMGDEAAADAIHQEIRKELFGT